MENAKMVRMANQIALYFDAYPHARAEQGVRGHIRKFWEPRMREQLLDYARADGQGMHPLVAEAVAALENEASERISEPAARHE